MNMTDINNLIKKREQEIIFLKTAKIKIADKVFYIIACKLDINQYRIIEDLYNNSLAKTYNSDSFNDFKILFDKLKSSGYLGQYNIDVHNENSILSTKNVEYLKENEILKFNANCTSSLVEEFERLFEAQMIEYCKTNNCP